MSSFAQKILDAVKDYHKKHNDYPSQSEVARILKRDRAQVYHNVGKLIKEDRIILRKETIVEPVKKVVTKIILKNKNHA